MITPVSPSRWILLFAALLAVAATGGILAMLSSGVPVQRPVSNAAALGIGLLIAMTFVRLRMTQATAGWLLTAAVLLLASTLLTPGIDGVHRWLSLGPVTITVASIGIPVAIVLLGRAQMPLPSLLSAIAAVLAILVAQPDASQATAFAVGSAILLAQPGWRSLPVLLILAATAALAWTRPDPLAPVPEVEGIFTLVWTVSPLLALVAALSLAAAAALPAIATRHGTDKRTGLALSACLAVACLAPALGAFPVPVVGYGMGFPIGFLLAFGMLLAPQPDQKP